MKEVEHKHRSPLSVGLWSFVGVLQSEFWNLQVHFSIYSEFLQSTLHEF